MNDIDQTIIDELEDFDSKDFWSPRRSVIDHDDYIDSFWGRQQFRSRSQEEAVVVAHNMVSSFLNSFARDGRYKVVFDPSSMTASTDMDARVTVITPAPILDQSIDAREAGRVLTGLSVHEISHPRYGRNTAAAVRRAFNRSSVAERLSNILDDVRIERRFIDDYPGYAGVFEPTRKYVGRGILKRLNADHIAVVITDQLNLMTAALRYPEFTDWTGLEAERDWWQAWSKKWSREDAPRRHVEAIREGLRHMAEIKAREDARQKAEQEQRDSQKADTRDEADQKGDEGPDQDQGSDGLEAGESDDEKIDADAADESGDASHEDDGEPEQDAPGGGGFGEDGDADVDASDEDEGDASDDGLDAEPEEDEDEFGINQLDDDALAEAASHPSDWQLRLPSCNGKSAVEQAATEAGVERHEIHQARNEAQSVVDENELYETDGNGVKVDVARSMHNLAHSGMGYARLSKTGLASRFIRDALLQSRTGHTDVAHYQKRGRVDQRALHRLAANDFRLFDRKRKASPGKYLIWIMVDRSTSMNGTIGSAAEVAAAIASATKHVRQIRAAVWAWSTSFRNLRTAGAARVWQTGGNVADIAKLPSLRGGGTPDSVILGWAHRAIRRDLRSSEKPVIVFCSDGFGSSDMNRVVQEARTAGVQVVSVAFGALNEDMQRDRFGANNYIPWQGDIVSTSRVMSKMIARLVTHDSGQGR